MPSTPAAAMRHPHPTADATGSHRSTRLLSWATAKYGMQKKSQDRPVRSADHPSTFWKKRVT
jgi:hypothetical protein